MILMMVSSFGKYSNTMIFTLYLVFIEEHYILFVLNLPNILNFDAILPFYIKKS